MNPEEIKDAVDLAEAFLRTPAIHALHLEWHKEKMKNPIYRAGFNSNDGDKNPFDTPDEIIMELNIAGNSKDPLLVEKLVELRDKLEATDWQQWGWGHHARKYIEKEVDLKG